MMIEYEGREDVLIGHLSSLLAAKDRDAPPPGSDTDDDEVEEEQRESGDFSLTTISTSASTLGTVGERDSSGTLGMSVDGAGEGRDSSDSDGTGGPEGVVAEPAVRSASLAVAAAGGSAAAAAAAMLAKEEDDDDDSDSSSAGSSEWSSEDGFSSSDMSFKTNDTDKSNPTSLDGLVVPPPVRPPPGAAPVLDPAGAGRGGGAALSSVTATELDAAIEAGDWAAVGATAALIASPARGSPPGDLDSNLSNMGASHLTASSNEEQQVEELEKLVEAGNWEAVMAAANRFDDASTDNTDNTDADCDKSRLSLTDLSATSTDVYAAHQSMEDSPPTSDQDIGDLSETIAEIAELVERVVPDELGT